MATTGAQPRSEQGSRDPGLSWPSPEAMLLGLVAFMLLVGTSVVGLLVGAAS